MIVHQTMYLKIDILKTICFYNINHRIVELEKWYSGIVSTVVTVHQTIVLSNNQCIDLIIVIKLIGIACYIDFSITPNL